MGARRLSSTGYVPRYDDLVDRKDKRHAGKNKKVFKEIQDEYKKLFSQLVSITGDLENGNKLLSLHVEVLIRIFLHNLDIYNQLIDARIKSPLDFE